MEFKVGDFVELRKDSIHAEIGWNNPLKIIGVIVSKDEETETNFSSLLVVWPGLGKNDYSSYDLKLCQLTEEEKAVFRMINGL